MKINEIKSTDETKSTDILKANLHTETQRSVLIVNQNYKGTDATDKSCHKIFLWF